MSRKAIFLILFVAILISLFSFFWMNRFQPLKKEIALQHEKISWSNTINVLCGQEEPDDQAFAHRKQMIKERIAQSFWIVIKENLTGEEMLFQLVRKAFNQTPPPLERAIQTGYLNFFFDLGYKPEVWDFNYRVLKSELIASEVPKQCTDPNFILISHFHETHHQGGLVKLVKSQPQIPVMLPALSVAGMDLPTLIKKVPDVFKDFQEANPQNIFKLPDGFTWLTNRIGTLVLTFKEEDGVENRETSLVINSVQGLTIVSGCSHATPEKVIRSVKEATGQNIYRFMGGTEWVSVSKQNMIQQMQKIKSMETNIIFNPNHCTPPYAQKIGRQIFNGNYKPLRLGDQITVE